MIEIRPRGGMPLDEIASVLRNQQSDLGNLRNCDNEFILAKYMEWVANTALHLRSRLASEDAAQLPYTPQYFALSSLSIHAPGMRARVEAEIRVMTELLDQLLTEVNALSVRWGAVGLFLVLDTNVLIQTKDPLDEIDWRTALNVDDLAIHLVIPMVVLEELDRLKRTNRRKEARRAIRLIERLVPAPGLRVTLPGGDVVRSISVEVLAEPLDHRRLPGADAEIVARASWLYDLSAKVELVTWDINMRFRAAGEGLTVHRLPDSMDIDYLADDG